MESTIDRTFDLQSAADELGVHYQTAYRWVRTGVLPAQLVGAGYVVDGADIAALAEARRAPRQPPRPTPLRRDRAAARVYDWLVVGDELAVVRLVRKLVGEGASITDVVQDVLAPPLRRIGQAWHDGEIPIWAEHRASSIVERLLGELAPNPRGRRRGAAVVFAIAGERHSLPTTMAAIALRDDNWHVHHLGADTPSATLRDFCRRHDVSLAVISVANSELTVDAEATADELREAGVPTIVGGPGRSLTDLVEAARAIGSGST